MERLIVVVNKDRSVVFSGDSLKAHNTRDESTLGVLIITDRDTQVGVFTQWQFWMRLDEQCQLTTEKPLARPLTFTCSKNMLSRREEVKLWDDLKKLNEKLKNPIIESWINMMGKRLAKIALKEFETYRRNVGAPKSVDTPEKLALWIELNTEKSK